MCLFFSDGDAHIQSAKATIYICREKEKPKRRLHIIKESYMIYIEDKEGEGIWVITQ